MQRIGPKFGDREQQSLQELEDLLVTCGFVTSLYDLG